MFVATIILPAEYGVYGFLGLWLMYAGLVGPGLASAGSREMPGLLGKGETAAAVRIQNVSLTPELVWSLIPFAVIIAASFFFTDFMSRVGLIIVGFSYLTGRLVNLWSSFNFIREKFNTVAAGNLIQVVAVPVITLLGVFWLKVYALLLAPLIVNIVLWLYYLKKGPIHYYFTLDRKEIFRLLKIGVFLQASTLVFWAYQLMGRTIVASMLAQDQLGLYTYAMGFVMIACNLPISFTSVLQPVLWRHAGKAASDTEGFKDANRIAIYLALGTAILVPLAQVGYYLVVNIITKNYIGSIPVFNILAYNIFLMGIVSIPNLVLNSTIANKQRITLIIYAVGLGINILFDVLVINLGYGISGVAWVTIASQCLIGIALFFCARRYISDNIMDYLRMQFKIYLPFIVSLGFFFLHRYLESNYGLRGFTGISLAVQVVVWGLVIAIFYRKYVSGKEIKGLISQIKDAFQARKKEG
jgi:O-antigen/teichoic acid export membrane protein